jgi:maleamate amidohydrolase
MGDLAAGDPAAGDLVSDYASAGFGGRLEWGERPALVVVDICLAYLDPGSPLYAGVEDAVASAGRLVEAARAAGVPVVFTRVEYEPGGADGGRFFQKVPALACFERGNPLAGFPEHPRPAEGEVVVTKQYASAFFGTSLASTLHAAGVDTAVVIGLSTSGCVRATALDALQHGFVPYVVADACGDRHPDPHRSNLFDLAQKYAEVIGEAEALRRFSEGAPRASRGRDGGGSPEAP